MQYVSPKRRCQTMILHDDKTQKSVAWLMLATPNHGQKKRETNQGKVRASLRAIPTPFMINNVNCTTLCEHEVPKQAAQVIRF